MVLFYFFDTGLASLIGNEILEKQTSLTLAPFLICCTCW